MTLDTFFRKLRRVPRTWRVTSGGQIRSGKTCPICAVAGMRGLRAYKAGHQLGLAMHTIQELVYAADGPVFCATPLRKRLRKACQLPTSSDIRKRYFRD